MPSLISTITEERPWVRRVTVETEERNGHPILVVKYSGSDHPRYLRYSRGPAQGFGWDIYGDDMQTQGLAALAIIQAPDPRSPRPRLEERP